MTEEADKDQQIETLQSKIDQLEGQLKRFVPQDNDDPFGPDWAPKTAQDMAKGILQAVEQKFPDMASKQQDQLAEAVMQKMEEKKKSEQETLTKQEEARIQAQIDAIKDIDNDFDDKKMWEWMKGVDNKPSSVTEAYKRFKEEYKEPEEDPKIDQGQAKGEGVQQPASPVPKDTDQALAEAMRELDLEG